MSITASSDRFHYLDSSRGLAALAVMFGHFVLVFMPWLNDVAWTNSPIEIFWEAKAAVMYFFIHSGFILTYRLQQSDFTLNIRSYLSFVTRRIFRIYPAFLVTLILGGIVLFLPLHEVFISRSAQNCFHSYWQERPNIWGILKQALLVIRLPQEPESRIIPQDWSLSIEMALSLMLPFLFVLRKVSSIGMLVMIYFAIQFLALDNFVFDFCLGIVVLDKKALFFAWWKKNNRFTKFILFFLGISLMTCDQFLPGWLFKHLNLLFIHVKAIGCLIIFLIILASTFVQQFLNYFLLIFIGQISYSIYLVHLIIMMIFFSLPMFSEWPLWLLFISISASVILISFIIYRLVELPFIKYGKSVSGKLLTN